MKIIKKVEATLETCRGHYPKVCYITFRKLKKGEFIKESEPRDDVVVDYDKDGNIVGIEFYEGLEIKKR